jgi:predicted secreted Zn-dependent protease
MNVVLKRFISHTFLLLWGLKLFSGSTSFGVLLSFALTNIATAYDLQEENGIVSEDITYQYYDVSGETLAEIEADLNAKGPIDDEGQRWWGDTDFKVHANDCDSVGFTAIVTLPRLDKGAYDALPLESQLVYDRMYTAQLNHEMRHVDSARHMAEVMKVFDCTNVSLDFVFYANTSELRLDHRSDHGRRNGVNLDLDWEGPLGDLPRGDDLITEEVIYDFYELEGHNLTDILIEIREKGPSGFWGLTRTRNFVKTETCSTRHLANLTMPRLSERTKERFSAAEKLEFLRMYTALHSHELRHVDNGRRYSEAEHALGCPSDDHLFFDYFSADQYRLDERSKHGSRQGLKLNVEVSEAQKSWLEWLFRN